MARARELGTDEGTQKVNLSELKNSDIANAIDEWIHSERDRKILKRRLIDGICYEPLAEEFELSTVQVKRIVRREQNRIARYVNDP